MLISKFLGEEDGWLRFRFYGAYKGVYLKKIYLKYRTRLVNGEDYIVEFTASGVNNGVLFGQIIKVKSINDCFLT